MPKIGETRIGTISRMEETYRVCKDCGHGFWGRVYNRCWTCLNQVGSEVEINGFIYCKLSRDDPYYEMCPRSAGLMGGSWIRKSRYVMAQQLGRCLNEDEQVWHKSRDKTDDHPENLELRVLKQKTEEQVRKTRAYKFGYEEGYEAGCEEGYVNKGGSLLQPMEKREMPKPIKRTSKEETVENQEHWAEKAKERQRR